MIFILINSKWNRGDHFSLGSLSPSSIFSSQNYIQKELIQSIYFKKKHPQTKEIKIELEIFVCSRPLLSGYRLGCQQYDQIKRWSNEIMGAVLGPPQFLKFTTLTNNTFKVGKWRATEQYQLHPRVMVCFCKKLIQEINSLLRRLLLYSPLPFKGAFIRFTYSCQTLSCTLTVGN